MIIVKLFSEFLYRLLPEYGYIYPPTSLHFQSFLDYSYWRYSETGTTLFPQVFILSANARRTFHCLKLIPCTSFSRWAWKTWCRQSVFYKEFHRIGRTLNRPGYKVRDCSAAHCRELSCRLGFHCTPGHKRNQLRDNGSRFSAFSSIQGKNDIRSRLKYYCSQKPAENLSSVLLRRCAHFFQHVLP